MAQAMATDEKDQTSKNLDLVLDEAPNDQDNGQDQAEDQDLDQAPKDPNVGL